MRKGIAFFLACLFALLFMMPPRVRADVMEGYSEDSGIRWAFNDETNVLTLSEGSEVWSGDGWSELSFASVVIEEGVSAVGAEAFADRSDLSSVSLPAGMESIGNEAFARTGLSAVTFPESISYIGLSAFGGCTNLTAVSIPGGTVDGNAFNNCTNLKSLTLDGVSEIGDFAFQNCGLSGSLTLPESVSRVDEGAFIGTGLTRVEIQNTDAYLYDKADTNTIFPAGVTIACYHDSTAEAYALNYGLTIEYLDDPDPTPPVHKHAPTHLAAVPATCEAAGSVEAWYCEGCGQYFSDAAAENSIGTTLPSVPAKGHAWDAGKVTAEATCTASGTRLYTCANDSTHTRTETIAALGHDYPETWSRDETNHWKTCTRCGAQTGLGAHVSSGPATEDTAETCTVCGYTLAPPLGHIHTNHLTAVQARAATCAVAGNSAYYRCSCGKLFRDVDATDEIVNPDEYTVPALGHVFAENWTSAAAGHWHVCERCGERDEVLAHTSSGPASELAAETCTDCGYEIAPRIVVTARIHYRAFGNLGLADQTLEKTPGGEDRYTVTLPNAVPVREGFYFEGWGTSLDDRIHEVGETFTLSYAANPDVTFTVLWTQVIGTGSYELKADTRYRFAEGRFTLEGDDGTVYEGERYFRLPADGSYTFREGGAKK